MVRNEKITTDGNKITMDGFVECEELVEMVETSLLKMKYKSSLDYVGIQTDNWPVFAAKVYFQIDKMRPIRGAVRKQ